MRRFATLVPLLLACCTATHPDEPGVGAFHEPPANGLSPAVAANLELSEAEVRELAEADGLRHYKNGNEITVVTNAVEAFFRIKGGAAIMRRPSQTQLASLGRLSGLVRHITLELDRTRDLSVLARIEGLKSLEVSAADEGVTLDLRVLDRLTGLEDLEIDGAPTVGLDDFIRRQSELAALALRRTTSPDFAIVAARPKLQFLFLGDLEDVDLEPLRSAVGLRQLGLHRVDAPSFAFIAGLTALSSIDIGDLDAALPFVCDAPQLGMIEIEGGKGDLSPLARCDLAQLGVSFTDLRDLRPIAHMRQLWALRLNNNPRLSDIDPLRGLPQLESVQLYGTKVRDLEPLEHLPRLDRLEVDSGAHTALAKLQRARPDIEASSRNGFDRDLD